MEVADFVLLLWLFLAALDGLPGRPGLGALPRVPIRGDDEGVSVASILSSMTAGCSMGALAVVSLSRLTTATFVTLSCSFSDDAFKVWLTSRS